MRARWAAGLAALALLLAPGLAYGQSPFTPLPPSQQTPTTTATQAPTTSTTSSDKGLSGTGKFLILLAAAAILGGIAFAIVKDARQRAPVAERLPGEDDRTLDARRRRAKDRARKKAKAARAQRKRNR